MKNFCLLVLLSILSVRVSAQAPEKMSYQAVIRDAVGNLVASSPIGMQISILQDSPTGTAVYVETHTASSNSNGLVSIEIGAGSVVSGSFAAIDWTTGSFFVQTEVDPNGGTSYTINGTSQLISVPYAFYSNTSGSSSPGPEGPAGESAYDIWIAQGNTGTHADFINSLEGPEGPEGPPGTNFFSNMQGGTHLVGPSLGSNIIVQNVTFPTAFAGTPNVICTASSEVGTIYDDSFNITTRQVSNTGFTIIVNRVDGSLWGQNMTVHWLAFE